MLREYLASYRAGLLTLGRVPPRESIDRLALPLGYWRHLEVPWTLKALDLQPRDRVLDVGSPKLAALLAARTAQVTATDIDAGFIPIWGPIARALRVTPSFQPCDARALPFADASFDKAYSISSLEHFARDGDIPASREIFRVLQPGGLFALTAPGRSRAVAYSQRGQYGEATREGDHYLWSRYYDAAWLRERIIDPAGWELLHQTFWRGRGFALGWPRPAKVLLPFLLPLFAQTIRPAPEPEAESLTRIET